MAFHIPLNIAPRAQLLAQNDRRLEPLRTREQKSTQPSSSSTLQSLGAGRCICAQHGIKAPSGSSVAKQQALAYNGTAFEGCTWPRCFWAAMERGGGRLQPASATKHQQSAAAASAPDAISSSRLAWLTRAIKNCSSIWGLRNILQQHEDKLNAIHICAMLVQLAKLPKEQFSLPLKRTRRRMIQQVKPNHSIFARQYAAELLQELLQRAQQHVHEFNQHGAASVVSALAQLHCHDTPLLCSICRVVEPQLSSFNGQSLTTLIGGLAQLEHRPSEQWLDAFMQATVQQAGSLTANQHVTITYSLSQLGYSLPSDVRLPFIQGMQKKLGSYGPWETSCSIKALSDMAYVPDDAWLAAYSTHSRRHLPSLSPSHLCRIITSLAQLQRPPEAVWTAEFAQVLQLRCREFSTAQLAAAMSSLAQLGHKPEQRWLDTLLEELRPKLHSSSAADLAAVLAALAQLKARPQELWMREYLLASYRTLCFMSPQQLSSVLAALAQIRYHPERKWLDEFVARSIHRLHSFSGQQLVQCMQAMARLNYTPSGAWLRGFEQHSNSRLASLAPQELTQLLGALAQLPRQPAVDSSWLYSFVLAAYTHLDSFSSAQLADLFEALPKVAPSSSWLDELVQICAVELSRGSAAAEQGAVVAGLAGQGVEVRWDCSAECEVPARELCEAGVAAAGPLR